MPAFSAVPMFTVEVLILKIEGVGSSVNNGRFPHGGELNRTGFWLVLTWDHNLQVAREGGTHNLGGSNEGDGDAAGGAQHVGPGLEGSEKCNPY